ncbi:MAG TPA: GAF domain-containing protein [Jatrophihabitans sp.]|nr:GAF domain-containing protein [Jatrophihabitans sp.]
MTATAEVTDALRALFPSVEPADLALCVRRAADDLGGSVHDSALPEMLTRLARLRLTSRLLGDDPDLATELYSAGTLPEVARLARRAVRDRLGCAGVTFVVRDGDKCFYADEDSIAPLWAGQRFPITECVSGWAMLHAEPAVIDDIELDERVPLAAYRSTYVRSMIVVPVSGPGAPAATIGAYWAETHRAGRADLGWLQGVAQATGAAVTAIGLAEAPWAPTFDPAGEETDA